MVFACYSAAFTQAGRAGERQSGSSLSHGWEMADSDHSRSEDLQVRDPVPEWYQPPLGLMSDLRAGEASGF